MTRAMDEKYEKFDKRANEAEQDAKLAKEHAINAEAAAEAAEAANEDTQRIAYRAAVGLAVGVAIGVAINVIAALAMWAYIIGQLE